MNGARISCAIVLVALISSSAAAQNRGHSAPTPVSPPPPTLPPSAPSTVTGSPSTVTPLVPNDRPDLFQAGPSTYTPHFDRVTPTRPLRGGYGAGVALPYGPYGSFGSGVNAGDVAAAGYLQVEVQPSNTQVYVDGLLVGRADDLRRMGQGRALDAGAHHVDLRADGYAPASADIRIDPRETTVYRAELKSIAPAPVAQGPPATPKTFFVIPGCYAGTAKPRDAQLPNGCDPHKMRAVPPVVSRVER